MSAASGRAVAELARDGWIAYRSATGATSAVIQATPPASVVQPDRTGLPTPAIEDADGVDLRPNPLSAGTASELRAVLQRFHQWAGEPSYRAMAEQCGQMVSASSMHRAMTSRPLPSLKAVLAVIAGCGGTEEDQRRFASAWRRIRLAGTASAASDRPAVSTSLRIRLDPSWERARGT